jgi:hypothetical protein
LATGFTAPHERQAVMPANPIYLRRVVLGIGGFVPSVG